MQHKANIVLAVRRRHTWFMRDIL